jgi:hypothetical protein
MMILQKWNCKKSKICSLDQQKVGWSERLPTLDRIEVDWLGWEQDPNTILLDFQQLDGANCHCSIS